MYYIISSLINASVSWFLGIFVLYKNPKAKVNRSFFFWCLTVALWSTPYFIWQLYQSTNNETHALFWSKALMLGAIWVPVAYFRLVCVFLEIKENKQKLLNFFYVLSIFFTILLFTPLMVKDIGPKMGFRFWPEPGIAYAPFLAMFVGLSLYAVYLSYRALNKVGAIKRYQIKYILLGVAISIAGGSTNYFLWYDIPIKPYGNIFASTYVILTAYAILKYRLMDIRMAVKRSTIFSGVVIMITAAYVLAVFLLSRVFFGDVHTFRTQAIVGLVVAFLIAIGFRPLYNWLRKITDTFLFKGEYRPQELMADISDILSRTLDLDKVIHTLRERISRALRVEKMEVVILEKGVLWKNHQTKEKENALKKLINYFKRQREVLVLEELKRKQAEKVGFDKGFLLIKDLEKLKAALAVPLLVKEKLVGLFLLSTKKSGDMFTNEDIKTLEAIAAQAAIAVENARLYEEMKDFSKTLQKEVNRQTKNLRKANVRLEQLDEAKSEFISLASHQLRTPLSIIKGYISMLLEGTWGTTNEKQREHLEKVYSSNERLIKLVEDLLTVSRIESGRLEFDFQPLDLDNLVESMIKEFSRMAAGRGLYLKYIKPEKSLPKVKVDSLKIRQVIQNLIENAIHYTKKGGAIIRLKVEKNKVGFSVEDTGIGISSEEQVTLFEKFSRGRGVARMHTEGTGLGLYLAAKLIEAHQGRIWVESEGKGKGSAFYFELPIKRKK